MIRLACKIPKKVVLACSGGRDSMSALEFLVRGKREVTVAYYDHGTPHGREAKDFLSRFCSKNNLEFVFDTCMEKAPKGKSKEEFWREKRYSFFKTLSKPIVMAHHLDDAVEWWIFSCLRGRPGMIPIERKDPTVIRPFLLTPKKEIHTLLSKYPHIEDPSNSSINFARNYIRHEIGPLCMNVNPGLRTTVRKLYEASDEER